VPSSGAITLGRYGRHRSPGLSGCLGTPRRAPRRSRWSRSRPTRSASWPLKATPSGAGRSEGQGCFAVAELLRGRRQDGGGGLAGAVDEAALPWDVSVEQERRGLLFLLFGDRVLLFLLLVVDA